MSKESPRRKGFFGAVGLPLAKAYIYPAGRNRLLWIGLGLAILVGGALAVDLTLRRGALVSNGPLSSMHAGLEPNCVSCHTPFQPVSDEKCSVCHEKFTDSLGTYTFNAHYVYLSGDRTRAFGRTGETSCTTCHMEHTGRDATLTAVPDSQCASCHVASFADHPQFAAALDPMGDDANLTFGHIRHLERVMDQRQLSNHELACLTCHTPTADGTRFEPISFDVACAGCHLGPDEQSEPLDVSPPGVPLVTRGAGEPVCAWAWRRWAPCALAEGLVRTGRYR